VLDPEVDDMPLVEDVRASRTGGPDGSGLVVVDGVWGAVAGGPPPVLFIDDGTRRHTLVALDAAPQDDPMAFRATFAVPADLVEHLDEGFSLGLAHTEFPLTLDAAPGIARRLAEQAADQPEDLELPPQPTGRFERGEEQPASRGGIAAAILRATEPPAAPAGATVVERSVIAERRARRSEQIAAVMERRARGAEDTAQELGARIDALEARLAEVSAERDRLAAELELQKATVDLADLAREHAEARLAEVLARRPVPSPGDDEIAAVRRLPGLEEAARAMAAQPPAPTAQLEPEPAGVDPFADALAKLRSGRTDLAAAVVTDAEPPVVTGESEIAATTASALIVADAPLPEQVVPYLISADHPRTPWLSWAIASLDERDREAAARLVAQLLPDQARTARRELVYDLDLEGIAPLRVELAADGTGRVLTREGTSPDAAFTVEATPRQFATLAAGGAPLWPSGLRVVSTRRFFLPLARLARRRRRKLTLAELVVAGLPLDPGLVIRALASAVPGEWTLGQAFAVTLHVAGSETCRVVVQDGVPLRVLRVDEQGRRSAVVASTTARAPVAAEGAVGGADAVLTLTRSGALPLLAHVEPPADEEPATVIGDLDAATRLLGWFDRVQGLPPRS
jgi:hypothetical protein